MFLLYSWGSLFGVPNKIPVVKIPEAKPIMSLLSLYFMGSERAPTLGGIPFWWFGKTWGGAGGRAR